MARSASRQHGLLAETPEIVVARRDVIAPVQAICYDHVPSAGGGERIHAPALEKLAGLVDVEPHPEGELDELVPRGMARPRDDLIGEGLLETQKKFIELRAQGLSFCKIAQKLKISKQTLVNWSKDFKEEIANLRAIELEALQEEYYLLREGRIRLFGETVQKIREELGRRDLSELSTDKLLDLLARYSLLLKEEMIEPVFMSEQELSESKEERVFLRTISSPKFDRAGVSKT